MNRREFIASSALLFADGSANIANAQSGPIRFIYPYAPGSGGDSIMRFLANRIGLALNENVIAENHTGADGRIGVRDVKAAAPNGRTLLFTPFGTMVLFPSVYADLPYDPFKDFTPVSQVVTYDFGLAAGPAFPGKSLADLEKWLKANPKLANFGMPGSGALPHLLPLKFAALIGVEIKAIAYKGAVPAVTEAIAGQIPLVCAPLSDLAAQHQAGRVRLLATSGAQRSPFTPDVPTFREQGYDVVGAGWYGIFAPSGSPPEMLAKITPVIRAAMLSAEGKSLSANLGLTPTATSPEELGAIQRADFERWAPVVKASGFTGNG